VRARRLGAEYQPHVFLIDKNGRVVGSFEGGGEGADWESLAKQLS